MTQELLILFKGFAVGFFYTFLSITGMVLVAHFVVKENWLSGMIASIGMITVQVIWAIIALVILHFSYNRLDPTNRSLSLIGSIILFLMAVKIYRSREKAHHEEELKTHGLIVFGTGFLLALAIPIRILGYFSIFAVINIHAKEPFIWEIRVPLIGVFLGALCFWIIFSLTIHHSKKILSPKTLQHMHKVSAFILIAFSIIGLIQIYL